MTVERLALIVLVAAVVGFLLLLTGKLFSFIGFIVLILTGLVVILSLLGVFRR